MSYPHVRVAATGRVEFFQSAEEFAAAASWTEREATGWVRTEGISPKTIQTTHDKIHLAGGWVRYNAENQAILSNRVVYVLTKLQDTWGVQARFACGASDVWQDVADEETRNVVRGFLQRLKAGDVIACTRLVRYPFIVVEMGTVHRFKDEASFGRTLPILNLTPAEISDVSVVQNGKRGANIAVSFHSKTRYENNAIFLADRREGTYRIASVSTI